MHGRPIAIVLAILWSFSFVASSNFYVQFVFNDFWVEFLAGVLLSRMMDKRGMLFAVSGVALFAFLIVDHYGFPERRSIYFGLPALAVVSFVLGFERSLKSWRSAVAARGMKFLGDASYSIYLSHFFSLNLVYAVIYKMLKLTGAPAGIAYFMIALAASLIVGGLAYVLLEKKTVDALKNMSAIKIKAYVNNQADTGAP
jgi:exopolysaccharide production protein ExoZ